MNGITVRGYCKTTMDGWDDLISFNLSFQRCETSKSDVLILKCPQPKDLKLVYCNTKGSMCLQGTLKITKPFGTFTLNCLTRQVYKEHRRNGKSECRV